MQARRSIEHPEGGGWSSVAAHLQPGEPGKQGFYLSLFLDARHSTVVFLRGDQVETLIDMAAQTQVTDQQIWDLVAKIPLEPLLPNRALAPRLRALLVDCAGAIRAEIRAQAGVAPAPSSAHPFQTVDDEPSYR